MDKNEQYQLDSPRQSPGSSGEGDYYHVEIQSEDDFTTFRTQDVGEPGHIQRVAGKRPTGSWATVKWLIGKEDAHVQDGRLVADTSDAREVLDKLGPPPVHVMGDRFQAQAKKSAPRRTSPQSRTGQGNMRKSQSTRHKK